MKALPNIISFFRICLVPVFVVVFFNDHSEFRIFAVLIFAIAGISDILDGIIARKFQAQSKLGKVLDPLADKLMTFTAIMCLTITRPILFWAVCVFFVKEALMGTGGLVLHRKGHKELPASNAIGKASTVTFFIICILLMLFRNLSDAIAVLMISVAVALTLVALASYIVSYTKIINAEKQESGE
ncbi:MAG: CDP-alcohol phosphatidyltransferase family protein [Oscillospiraceae bacterium]|nr:CDP-alcohol phosphatidyltransferase family protein [Oscillospiraceae bacterium]MCL2249643.1 CDP-alcohol phosphatidyltransferase family protein [Oscillospiraceae bacterium]